MVFGSETWNLKIVEKGIFRRTERAMIQRMCGVKVSNRKNTTCELKERLGLEKTGGSGYEKENNMYRSCV